MQQQSESLDEYYQIAGPDDPWFLACLPMIMKQRYPDKRLTDVGAAEAVHCVVVRTRHVAFASMSCFVRSQ